VRTKADKALMRKQIISELRCITPRRRVVDALRVALSVTPVVRRRLSPLRLRRMSCFEVQCDEVEMLPRRIGRKGFYLAVREGETSRRTPPLCLDDDDRAIFWNHIPRFDQGMVAKMPPVFLAGLRNASILNNGVTIRSCDNSLLCDPFHLPKYAYYHGLPRLVLPPVDLNLRGEYIHFGVLWGLIHYHWVLDLLPRLLFLERFDRLRGLPLIVQRGITQAQRESLHILGIRPERIIEFNGGHWQVEHLYYLSPGLTDNPTPLSTQWLRERFTRHSTRSRRLYVSRKDASVRRIVNEADLVKELAPYGFEVVTLSGMAFADQVQLFNEAQIIVGPHGAGFANAVFMQPGATLIETFSPSYINGCYWALANACGHRYGFTVGTQRGEDIQADIGKVLRLLVSMSADASGP
jgi:capsular polysaccharide biosynthesis protein